MIEVKGKYNTAKVYIDQVGEETIAQILELCNQEFTAGSTIRIMPDTHKGAGCTIGTTMTIRDKIVPNLVGVDIGCGVEVAELAESEIDFAKLDRVIREHIPSGSSVRSTEHPYVSQASIDDLRCRAQISISRARLSIGTLGGGNHYIEIDRDDQGRLYLAVHSGSRHMGKQIAEYYQKLGHQRLTRDRQAAMVTRLKAGKRDHEIHAELQKFKAQSISKDLAYVEGQDYADYLHDMVIAQVYATINRKAMVEEITKRMGLHVVSRFTTIHNYIDTESMILRKGAISAQAGEKLIIPINMRDGALICVGRGNPDWNYSAPHGAGRLLSRGEAKRRISIEDYRRSMDGIYTTSVDASTLDEAAMAYKPMEQIIRNIGDTVEITAIVKPVYNFKAGE